MSGIFGFPFIASGKVKAPREWPPSLPIVSGLLAPIEYAKESYKRLAELPRDQWTADDWKTYALFLEERGKWLLDDLRTADVEHGNLRARVKEPRKVGRPRTRLKAPFGGGGLLYGALGVRVRGRPRDPERESTLQLLAEWIEETRQSLQAEKPGQRITDRAVIERALEEYARANNRSAVRLKQANVKRLQKLLSEARRTVPKNP